MSSLITSNHPNRLPPSNLAIGLNRYFQANDLSEQDVLDSGCSLGRNSQYLGALGHSVVGVSLSFEEVALAAKHDYSARSTYLVADIRTNIFRKMFDAVVISEVLHMMPKNDSKQTLRLTRSLTKPGGVNAVSGYLITPDVADEKNRDQCFQSNELRASYLNMGWDIIDYSESVKPVSYFRDSEMISSIASVIAQKPR
jgi:SAM-dependent methyltransferase